MSNNKNGSVKAVNSGVSFFKTEGAMLVMAGQAILFASLILAMKLNSEILAGVLFIVAVVFGYKLKISLDESNQKLNLAKNEIKNLRELKENDDLVRAEVIDVLEKLQMGFLGYKVELVAKDEQMNKLSSLVNSGVGKFNNDIDLALTVLGEYGNSNFDFAVNLDNSSGKTGSLLLGIRALGSSVSELLALISITANELKSNIEVLSSASEKLSVSSNQQAVSLEETSASLEEITSAIINNTANTNKMMKFTDEISKTLETGRVMAVETTQSMGEITDNVRLINEAVEAIEKIAFQTNVLSLNSAVEAAKAGEAGRGFAVVAQEIRHLATRSSESAKSIKKLVEHAMEKTLRGQDVAAQMTDGYNLLNTSIIQTIELMSQVSEASNEQRLGIEQINDAVTQLDQVTQKNAQASLDISSMASDVSALAKDSENPRPSRRG